MTKLPDLLIHLGDLPVAVLALLACLGGFGLAAYAIYAATKERHH